MRRTTLAVIAAAILATVAALGVAATTTRTSAAADEQTPVASPTAGTDAYEYMAELSDELGIRVAGLSTETHAGDRILQWFTDLGYTPDVQEFFFTAGDERHHSRNIVAVKPGVSSRQIVIGAHYDTDRVGRGAFDNATGVALMMELADALRDERTPYTLVFVAFGAEEAGLQGSTFYVNEMSAQQRADTALMINLDSVATGDRMYAYSSEDAAWPQLAFRSMARGLGISFLTNPGLSSEYPYGTTGDWSDQAPFRQAGIPYLYLEATNWLLGDKDGYANTYRDGEIWHSKRDTLSFIEQRYPGRLERQLDDEFTALAAFLTRYQIPAVDLPPAPAEGDQPQGGVTDLTATPAPETTTSPSGEAQTSPGVVPAATPSAQQ